MCENMEEEISLKKWILIAFLGMVIVWFIWIIAFASGTPWIGLLFSAILIVIIYLILVLKYKKDRGNSSHYVKQKSLFLLK